MMRRTLRRALETSPFLAECWRTVRDLYLVRARPRTSPLGFRFVGSSEVAGGSYEPEMTRLCGRLLEEAELFVDVGSNMGYYACLARQAGARVVAIEPSMGNLRFLMANLSTNGWLDVEVWAAAVAAAPGLSALHGCRGGASLLEGWKPRVAKSQRETVPVSTLDILLGGRFGDQRLLIKVDVEGAQLAALRGAAATLGRRPSPDWLVEIYADSEGPGDEQAAETFELFWARGYRAYAVEGGLSPVTTETLATWRRTAGAAPRAVNFLFTQRAPREISAIAGASIDESLSP